MLRNSLSGFFGLGSRIYILTEIKVWVRLPINLVFSVSACTLGWRSSLLVDVVSAKGDLLFCLLKLELGWQSG